MLMAVYCWQYYFSCYIVVVGSCSLNNNKKMEITEWKWKKECEWIIMMNKQCNFYVWSNWAN